MRFESLLFIEDFRKMLEEEGFEKDEAWAHAMNYRSHLKNEPKYGVVGMYRENSDVKFRIALENMLVKFVRKERSVLDKR